MAERINVRYVMILQIEKIVTQSNSIYDNSLKRTVEVESGNKKTEVVKVMISDTDLTRLLDRGAKHMSLVQDEETDTTIGKPRA